jgi:hypothetical protein
MEHIHIRKKDGKVMAWCKVLNGELLNIESKKEIATADNSASQLRKG